MVLFSREALGLKISLVPGAIKLSSSCSARLKGLPRPEPLETHKSFRHTYTCTHRGHTYACTHRGIRAHTEDIRTRAHTEAYLHTQRHTYTCTHRGHAYTCTCTHRGHTYTCTHKGHAYTCTHRGIRMRAHTEDTRTRARAHTEAYVRVHTQDTEVFKPAAKETYSYELAKKDQQAVVKSFNFSMLAGTVNQHV